MKAENVFHLIDLAEYENLQEDLAEWAKNNRVKYKEVNKLSVELETDANDNWFSLIYLYTHDNRAIWITTEDSEVIFAVREDYQNYRPLVEIWVSEELDEANAAEEIDDAVYEYDAIGSCNMDIDSITTSIQKYFKKSK